MFRNARVGDRVWSFTHHWGTIIETDGSLDKTIDYPLLVKFDNDIVSRYTIDGKYNKDDTYPTLFWDEIKYEIPEKPFNLENELRQLEITEFRHGGNNQFLTWSNEFKNIDSYYFNSFQNPFLIYFTKESIDNFRENIKNKKITKEQFFLAYKKVFGGSND